MTDNTEKVFHFAVVLRAAFADKPMEDTALAGWQLMYATIPWDAIDEGLGLLELALQNETVAMLKYKDAGEVMMEMSCQHAAESLGKSVEQLRELLAKRGRP